jgi:hypothetical protein
MSADQKAFADLLEMEAAERSANDPINTLRQQILRIHHSFCDANGIRRSQEPVRPTDAERELNCAGFYSLQATGETRY